MSVAKIAISLDRDLLSDLDALVGIKQFKNRSQLVSIALNEKLMRLKKNNLLTECLKLNRGEEELLAEMDFGNEGVEWPEY